MTGHDDAAEKLAGTIVDLAMSKATKALLGAVIWSIGLGLLNTVLLIAVLVVVIVR